MGYQGKFEGNADTFQLASRPDLVSGVAALGPPHISKRFFDIASALVLLAVFSPIMLFVAVTIWVSDRQKVVFFHERIGKNGRTFKCLKFRTMCVNSDERLRTLLRDDPVAREEWETRQKLEKDPRITAIGNILRKTSLDELPQLWNILRGDMSMVGPRPIVDDEVRHYGTFFAAYKSVRPGLTGAWQVSGRSNTTYTERVALDVDYIKRSSLGLDMTIVLRTVSTVLLGKGAS